MKYSATLNICLTFFWVVLCYAQDYQVDQIKCQVSTPPSSGASSDSGEVLTARVVKPQGFTGHPVFVDALSDEPNSEGCQLTQDQANGSGLVYRLQVTDFQRCGVVRKDGYVTLRVWFPRLEGVILATDQEVIIMCKPASPTVIQNRAAGFAGALPPPAGRVSGVVEESPGRLEYEVALYREVRGREGKGVLGGGAGHDTLTIQGRYQHTPVAQAVPIGSRLQLRASINTGSTWKYLKLMEVTVSSDSGNPHAKGHVALVRNGCRHPDYSSIVPQQPHRSPGSPGEVRLNFEAFMLDSKLTAGSEQLWIHATIKACISDRDCKPEFCLDLFQPSGYGRKRRRRRTHSPDVSFVTAPTNTNTDNTNHVIPGRTSHLAENYMILDSYDYTHHDAGGISSNYNESYSQQAKHNDTHTESRLHYQEEEEEMDEAVQSILLPLPEPLVQQDSSTRPVAPSTKIDDNVGMTVMMPQEFFTQTEALYHSCSTFLLLSGVLGLVVVGSLCLLCLMMSRVHKMATLAQTTTLDTVIKDHNNKYGLRNFLQPPFQ